MRLRCICRRRVRSPSKVHIGDRTASLHAGGGASIYQEQIMITRFAGLTPTRSRAVVHDGLVFTVAVAPDPVTPSLYEQTVKALARIDESLALCGTDKSKILSAIIYITDMKQKGEMNRAWDQWVDTKNPPMRACIGVELEAPHIVEILVTAAK